MFSGSPAPLHAATPLFPLLAQAEPGDALGAWIRGSRRLLLLRAPGRRLLAGSDLGALLQRCRRLAVRQDRGIAVLEAHQLIAWRTLQVTTGMPYLPSAERLRALFPDLLMEGCRLEVRLGLEPPEAVLAACVAERIEVRGSRICYRA
jgi:hypothetical protein